PAAAVPRLRADRTANTFGACGACHAADTGAGSGPATVGIPNTGTTVGPGVSTAAARLTLEACDTRHCLQHRDAGNGSRRPVTPPSRTGWRRRGKKAGPRWPTSTSTRRWLTSRATWPLTRPTTDPFLSVVDNRRHQRLAFQVLDR